MTVDASTPITPLKPAPTAAGPSGPVSAVGRALRNAAQATGASFDYLLATAKVESNLNPNLSMRGSSATGLFQFIEQTWLSMVKQAGNALGFGGYANSIQQTSSGRYVVSDPAARQEIMKLRKDPAASALMAGVFTQQNSATVASRIGRQPSDDELYIAHFFGPTGASKLIGAAGQNPTANAASMFPAAARANRSIFYDKQGNARSVAGVYGELTGRYQTARASQSPGPTPMATARAPLRTPVAQALPLQDTAGVTEVLAAANPANASVRNAAPAFHSLFSTDDRRGGVAAVVNELWGAQSAAAPAPTTPAVLPANSVSPANTASAAAQFNLFQDMPPNARGLFKAGS